jgi:FKBP-type peptidyl-prolyl cis-trans isomerase FklB
MGIGDKLFQMKQEKAAANLKAGQDFLEANKQKPGVVTLPSGLQYEIITEGNGPKPTATSSVTCHYHGTLIDGTVFDSSVKRGQPATFPLNRVIKGWTEGLQLMPTGSKWRFFLPPQLAYGEQQVSAQIGPNSTLIFEVELLSFK